MDLAFNSQLNCDASSDTVPPAARLGLWVRFCLSWGCPSFSATHIISHMIKPQGITFECTKPEIPPPTKGSGCKLCPWDWLLHGNKCYWLSKESKDWTRSRDHCLGKSAQMLVIQNQEEMDFIQDVTQGSSYIWIGLTVTPAGGKWTWVDGSPLDPIFQVSGSAEGNSCGWIRGSRIQSETCGAEFKWICQKEAAVI
uniref:C-type lectin domain-containing protein n=1 Tax=Chelonoidis abingdonii TaxID=106734 RepID=A0A8C0J2W2_CHEAB